VAGRAVLGGSLMAAHSTMNDVTCIFSAIEQGDPRAVEQLLPLVYDELRRLASAKLAHEFPHAPKYREALRPQPDGPDAHVKAADALRLQRRWAEAEAEYRVALRLRPDHPRALQNIGPVLGYQGKNVTAARFYAEALPAHLRLAEDTAASVRYNAACAAARAGCGLRQVAAKLDDAGRARLRRQALDWLRADLAALDKLLREQPAELRDVISRLTGTLGDTSFDGVRGAALAMLPEVERRAWQQLWKDYEQMLKRVSR
jgi:tetratricopeptide (TPR) repeat protein